MISFNKAFYSLDAVTRTKEEFSGLCDTTIEENEKEILVHNTPREDIDQEELEDEFRNYCLSLMKGKQRAADYSILPHKVTHFKKDLLLISDVGSWIFLKKEKYSLLLKHELTERMKSILEKNLFILTKNNVKALHKAYYNKHFFLYEEPSLHIIELTNACEHRCTYCHVESGLGEKHKSRFLSEEDADKILGFIFQLKRNNLTIELQGGEPLLNFKTVKHIITSIREMEKKTGKKVKILLVSTLRNISDEQIEYLINEDVDITTSLDGPKQLHDRNRPILTGSSHDDAIKNIRKISQTYNYPIGALLVVTKESLTNWKEVVDEYVSLGLHTIQLKKVHRIGNAEKTSSDFSTGEYMQFWKKSLDYMISLNLKGVPIRERLTTIIMKKMTNRPVLFTELQSPCGMITGQLAYTTGGEVYSCDIARGRELFNIGDVEATYSELLSKDNTQNLIEASINTNPSCDACPYQVYCGICPVLNYRETGNLIAKTAATDKCKQMKAIFAYIFEAMSDPAKRAVLLEWAK